MKKLVMTLVLSILLSTTVMAQENEPKVQRVTVYCQNSGQTYSGTFPMAGRTVAGRREDVGKAAVLYMVDHDSEGNQIIGDLVGIYQIEDTGSHPRLQTGAIDVFCNTDDECWQWVKKHGDFLYVQIIEGGKG